MGSRIKVNQWHRGRDHEGSCEYADTLFAYNTRGALEHRLRLSLGHRCSSQSNSDTSHLPWQLLRISLFIADSTV